MRVLEPQLEVMEANPRQEVLQAWIDRGMLSLSLCNQFPEDYTQPHIEIWAMLLSDIFHHVVDAIVLETGQDKAFVQRQLKDSFEEVLRSQRHSRSGTLREFDRRLIELPDPDVSGDDNCVEIARIFLLAGSIRVLLLVGMWLPDDEESVWGNLLYDLSYMIASSMKPDDIEELHNTLAQKMINYVDEPSTRYSGEYYTNEQLPPSDKA
jgi:hypothetical protein